MIPRYSSLLAAAEVGLGSLLHAAQIPLAGHWLSLNQGLILSLATKSVAGRAEAIRATCLISTTAALFKALSPAGKRLTPMLAISVQGVGYAIGVAVGGSNLIGSALGMTLLSLWGFLQPILVAYLLFGKSWFAGLQKFWLEVAAFLQIPAQLEWWVLGAVVLVKVLAGLFIVGVAWNQKGFESEYERTVRVWQKKFGARPLPTASSPLRGVLRDLLSWPFLVAMAFSLFFFVYSGEKSALGVWTWLLRPVVAGIVFFWLLRSVPETFWEKTLHRFPLLESTYRETFRSRS